MQRISSLLMGGILIINKQESTVGCSIRQISRAVGHPIDVTIFKTVLLLINTLSIFIDLYLNYCTNFKKTIDAKANSGVTVDHLLHKQAKTPVGIHSQASLFICAFGHTKGSLLQAILCHHTFSCSCLCDIIPKNKRG